jgi:spore germination protein GerM
LIDGDHLVAVDRSVSSRGAAALIDSLLEGPTDEEATEGIRSALESADVVSSVDQQGRQMAIDLTPAFTETPPTEQRLALAQLTFTATEDPVVREVAFTLDGEAISVPRADGTTSDGPVRRADYRSLAP